MVVDRAAGVRDAVSVGDSLSRRMMMMRMMEGPADVTAPAWSRPE